MTTGPGTGRLSTSEVARALLNRTPAPPESSVTIGTTAKRIHAPISGQLVYVIDGEGFYEHELTADIERPMVEPQSLRVAP